MLNTFRFVSMAEGLSFLLLLFVAMPAKYYLGHPEAVTAAGWTHGLLFMAYIFLAQAVFQRHNWPDSFKFFIMLASVVPFACFFVEKRLRENAVEVTVKS